MTGGEGRKAAVRADGEARADPFLSPRRGGTELYLIRHADALPGPDEVAPGGYDAQALSELGRRQAAALAERVARLGPVAVYSSPAGRARQTALPLARVLGLEVRVEPELREVELGAIDPVVETGATPQERAERLREMLREIAAIAVTTGAWSSIPGAEPSAALRARATAALDGIAARHRGERVAVVSHAGTINAYVAALLELERDYFFPAANTSISVVRVNGPRRLLLSLNDTAHLGA